MVAQWKMMDTVAFNAESDLYIVYPMASLLIQMSHVMTKPVFAVCEQQRHRSACASAQSDQRLCYSLYRYYNTFTC